MADIVDTALQDGHFTTLLTALKAVGLLDTLKGAGPFTLFAPTDEAFERLTPESMERLLNTPSMLRNLLSYHVINGKFTTDDLKNQHIRAVGTLAGEDLSLDTSTVGRVMVNNATVVRHDIVADNGIIHAIDHVMVPPSMRQQRAA